jgi:predicted Zn-ribbon and HTH transcriptional regulator
MSKEAGMDLRKYHRVLDNLSDTITDYDEETVFAALKVIADRFGWELSKQPDPCCDFGWHYERQGIMTPIHECPSPRPDLKTEEMLDVMTRESDRDLVTRAFVLPRRWL